MRLIVGIPAFNEEASIGRVIEAIPLRLFEVSEVAVVVVDDGSTDKTAEIAAAAGAHLLRHPHNTGLGAAFQTLVRHALEQRADILVTLDGDGQFNPEDIPRLVAPLLDKRALVCTASRFADPSMVPTMPWIKKWGNRRVAGLVNMLTGHRYADVSCGFRAYTREALLRMTIHHSFTYTHETFLDLTSKNIPILEVPIEVRGTREFGASKIATSVLRYGIRTALIMLSTYRDQRPLRLCAWLAVPLAMLGTALLSWSYIAFYRTDVWLKWAGFLGGSLISLSVLTVLFGFMADMATRLRRNQEEMLYWLRCGVVAPESIPHRHDGEQQVPPSGTG